MAKDFKQGVLVWAKMKGFPPWPAKVAFPTDGKPPKSKRPQHFVNFFGTHDNAWVFDKFIFPHSEEMLENAKSYKKISSTMQAAIQEIEHASRIELLTEVKKEPISSPPSPVENFQEEPPKKSKKKAASNKKIKVEIETLEVGIETPKIEKKIPKIQRKTRKYERKATKIVKKKPIRRSASAMLKDTDRGVKIKVKKEDSDEDDALLNTNVPSDNGNPNVAVIPPYSDDAKPNFTIMNFNETFSNLPSTSGSSNEDIFLPTSKKIGFLGLGVMGCMMVKKLLGTGHNVIIWNRTILDIYATFVEMGAKTARHPADVLQDSDITFCCVSDAEAAKSVVFGEHGVLAGFNGLCINKAYVEMTSIDPVTSQKIGEAITGRGGRYLEAPMFGTRQDLKENAMTILAAGNRSVFNDCNTVFASFAKNAIFVNCEVGFANKISVLLNMMAGITYAALSESINIVEKYDLDPSFFMDIIANGPASCPLILGKGRSMITNDPTVHTPIKHQQRNLAMAMALADTTHQPLALASAANEVFKRGLRHDRESDVSAIRKYFA